MPKEFPRIDITVDAIIFGYKPNEGISVLLIKRKKNPFKSLWALPGGFVEADESLDQAASRELKEETGMDVTSLEQLYTFGEPKRDPRKRIISVAYFAIVKPELYKVHAADDAAAVQWFNIKKLPPLAFDHEKIVETAIFKLRKKVFNEPVGFELLNKQFAFTELHRLYETLCDKKINTSDIKKKLLSLGLLKRQKRKSEKQKKSNLQYKFNKSKYFKLKKKGIALQIN